MAYIYVPGLWAFLVLDHFEAIDEALLHASWKCLCFPMQSLLLQHISILP